MWAGKIKCPRFRNRGQQRALKIRMSIQLQGIVVQYFISLNANATTTVEIKS